MTREQVLNSYLSEKDPYKGIQIIINGVGDLVSQGKMTDGLEILNIGHKILVKSGVETDRNPYVKFFEKAGLYCWVCDEFVTTSDGKKSLTTRCAICGKTYCQCHTCRAARCPLCGARAERPGYFLLIFGICLAIGALLAAVALVTIIASGIRFNKPIIVNDNFQDFLSWIAVLLFYFPLKIMKRRVRMLSKMPKISYAYVPIILCISLLIFIEYRLAVDYLLNLDNFSISKSLNSLLVDAKNRWLYLVPFVSISLSFLQRVNLLGSLLPSEVEDTSNEISSLITGGIVAVISISISAIIKLLLMTIL